MESTHIIFTLICAIVFTRSDPVGRQELPERLLETRRILNGKVVGETRPYMVYLRPSAQTNSQFKKSNWLCGGVIIHPRYILTSAACIEDAKNFYVVSGTNIWTPFNEETECIKNGAKKAIWKCVPKNYYFDGADFDNIRWMSGDIAVVKVESDFNFLKRARGCDYIPKILAFNNISEEFEKANTMGSAAGWGSISHFGDLEVRRAPSVNSIQLLETDVQIISKSNCIKRWEKRYHNIIEKSMICSKDDQDSYLMSTACIEGGINCKELEYSAEDENAQEIRFKARSRRVIDPNDLEVHDAGHHQPNLTRRFRIQSGGFCENDHGGPLIVGQGSTSRVVGIISACMTKDISKKCYGPYLYSSVWIHRHLISCAIDKDIGSFVTCRKAFGDVKTPKNEISETVFDWAHHNK